LTYEELISKCDKEEFKIIEKVFKSKVDGLCVGNIIGINSKLNSNSKLGILAEEIGHFYTTVGDIIDLDTAYKRQRENRARKFAYDLVVGLDGITEAYENGCKNLYDSAEFLNISPEFLKEAIEQYKLKFGANKKYKGYLIKFIPNLDVIKLGEKENDN